MYPTKRILETKSKRCILLITYVSTAIFLVTYLFPSLLLAFEVITHWIPPQVYEIPQYESWKVYELYEKPKSVAVDVQRLEKEAIDFYKDGCKNKNEGRKIEAETNFKESKTKLQEIIKNEPKLPQAYFWLGMNETALGNTTEAETYFIQYMKCAPNKIKPYLILADHYRGLNKIEKARMILDQALRNVEFKPVYSYLINNRLGVVYYYLQNYTLAESHFQKALEKLEYNETPNIFFNTLLQLAQTCTLHADITNDPVIYEEALDTLTKIEPLARRDNNQNLFIIYALRGYINGKLKNYTNAQDDLNKALSLNAFDINTKRNLKRIQKNKEKAHDITIQKYAGWGISGLAGIFLCLLLATFYRLEISKFRRKIEEGKTTYIYLYITVAFIFITIGLILPYISSIKWGEIEVNLQNPNYEMPDIPLENPEYKSVQENEKPSKYGETAPPLQEYEQPSQYWKTEPPSPHFEP